MYLYGKTGDLIGKSQTESRLVTYNEMKGRKSSQEIVKTFNPLTEPRLVKHKSYKLSDL